MKRASLILLCSVFFILIASTQDAIGSDNGIFSLHSGDGIQFNSSELKGKVSVIFYETKDTIEQNRTAKNQLNELFDTYDSEIQKLIIRLPVIDCSNSSKLFRGIWKKKLVENSENEGMVIFGDWSGEMKKAFSFQTNEIYLVIVNQNGNVVFNEKGQLNNEKIDTAKKILIDLLRK